MKRENSDQGSDSFWYQPDVQLESEMCGSSHIFAENWAELHLF